MRAGLLIAVFILLSAMPALAQTVGGEEKQSYMYQWTDSEGIVHITDSLDKVPEPYRSRARRLEAAPGEAAAPSQPRKQGPPPSGSTERYEAQQKAVWKQRINDAKKRLAGAEKRYRDLEQKRDALLGQRGTPAYAPPEARVEAERLSGEMQTVQKEIERTRNELEVVIPEEARKAGVPPGWLRE